MSDIVNQVQIGIPRDAHLTRQAEIIPSEVLDVPITVVGAGAVGSFTVLALAKMGFSKLTVYDFDKIEIENMNNQFYPLAWVGEYKVLALSEMVQEFTGILIEANDRRYTPEETVAPGIIITAVDSMAARKMIWGMHKMRYEVVAYIDPRMSSEAALLYTMNTMNQTDITDYEKTLYTDEQGVQEPCTAKATMYTSLLISGLVCKAVKDVVVKSEKYIRMAMWNIKANDLHVYSRKVLHE